MRTWGLRGTSPAALEACLREENVQQKSIQRYAYHLTLERRTAHYTMLRDKNSITSEDTQSWTMMTRYVLDKNACLLPLKSIVLPHQMAKLNALQRQYWFDAAYGGKDIAALSKELGYEAGSEFEPSDNWGFAQGGLLFEFQHDWGEHTIIIPAAKLRDIIKPQFLREIDGFRVE